MEALRSAGKVAGLFLVGAFVRGGWAAPPDVQVTLDATATNLVVTEETCFVFRLWLPPLEGDLADVPPFLARRPPHLSAAFLTPEWKTPALAPVDPRRLPPVESRLRDRNAPFYTLNNYVSDDVFGGMRDPFSLLGDDDFFGRALGPQAKRFPFTTRRVERGGVNGWEFAFETLPYRAVAPGRVELAPVAVKLPILTGVRTRRDGFGRAVRVPDVREATLQTPPLVVEVRAPPTAGRPATDCGAIASNLTVTATLDASVCTAGDPLTLTLDVAGAANPAALVPPAFADALNATGVFRLDAASLKTETLAASRRFTWRVRTLKAGTVEFPALAVSYYNLGARAYATVRTATIPVQVKAGAQATLGALDAADGTEDDAFPLPDGLDLDPRGAAAEPLLPHLGLAAALFAGAPLLFVLVRLAPPVRRRLAARRAAHRRATALARCRRALKSRDVAKRTDAIRRFFADRYGVNGATVTAADARRLMAADFPPEDVALVADALADADRLAYAAKTTVVSLILLLLLPLGLCAAPSFVPIALLPEAAASTVSAASAAFTYRRACALATRATTEADFRAAAAAFAAAAREGAANPVLFANLGACAALAGDGRAAATAYGRAERRGGETASTRRGVRAAYARLKNDPRADVPLTRVFFRPHFQFSVDARLVFAAVVWTLGWLAALLPPGACRRLLLTALVAAFAATAVSVSTSLVAEAVAEGASHAEK